MAKWIPGISAGSADEVRLALYIAVVVCHGEEKSRPVSYRAMKGCAVNSVMGNDKCVERADDDGKVE